MSQSNLGAQKLVFGTALVLFIIKTVAWYMTGSVAIFTDAMESTVNVVAGALGLYSIYLSAQPRDANHPYGHGKVEFVSAAIEGTMIAIAGVLIIIESAKGIIQPVAVEQLDSGIILIAISALVNFLVGQYAVNQGRKNKSLALVASGKHLQADTITTIGILLGLTIMYFSKLAWIDSATALIFAAFILYTGIKIIREALAGIMDEADNALVQEIVAYLNAHRRENWVDVHNLRIIKYGGFLHLDCHLTVPWYFNVHQAHEEVEQLEALIRAKYELNAELFVHTDGCMPYSCSICTKSDCSYRNNPLTQKVEWTLANVSSNQKHGKPEGI